MQRLRIGGKRVCGARVEAAQFKFGAQHVFYEVQNRLSGHQLFEDLAFIDEIRQTARARLGAEFRAGVLSFERIELFYPRTHFVQLVGRQNIRQNNVAERIEVFPLLIS